MKNSRAVNFTVNVANTLVIFVLKYTDFAQCVCNLLAVPNVIICIVVYGYHTPLQESPSAEKNIL